MAKKKKLNKSRPVRAQKQKQKQSVVVHIHNSSKGTARKQSYSKPPASRQEPPPSRTVYLQSTGQDSNHLIQELNAQVKSALEHKTKAENYHSAMDMYNHIQNMQRATTKEETSLDASQFFSPIGKKRASVDEIPSHIDIPNMSTFSPNPQTPERSSVFQNEGSTPISQSRVTETSGFNTYPHQGSVDEGDFTEVISKKERRRRASKAEMEERKRLKEIHDLEHESSQMYSKTGVALAPDGLGFGDLQQAELLRPPEHQDFAQGIHGTRLGPYKGGDANVTVRKHKGKRQGN
jgi:hypothetical protein